MSQWRPPSPIHPALSNESAIPVAREERLYASMSPVSYRRTNRLSGDIYLPPIQTSRSSQHQPGLLRTLPQIPVANSSDNPGPSSNNLSAMSLSNLLSPLDSSLSLPRSSIPWQRQADPADQAHSLYTTHNASLPNRSTHTRTSHPRQPHSNYMTDSARSYRSNLQNAQANLHCQQQQQSASRPPIRERSPTLDHISRPALGQSYTTDDILRKAREPVSNPLPTTGIRSLRTFMPPPPPRACSSSPYAYNLIIRQQPNAARACGFGERDRRVIDPPPIIELVTTSRETGDLDEDISSMLALHCTLIHETHDTDETEIAPLHPGQVSARRLMGTLVASPSRVRDEYGKAGVFFVFPDLSCRSPGRYRLQLRLLRVDSSIMTPGMRFPCVVTTSTRVFTVYTAKEFPGMRASSDLLKALRRQGVIVGVKKGSEQVSKRNEARSRDVVRDGEESPDEAEDSADDGAMGQEDSDGMRSTSAGGSLKKAKRQRKEK